MGVLDTSHSYFDATTFPDCWVACVTLIRELSYELRHFLQNALVDISPYILILWGGQGVSYRYYAASNKECQCVTAHLSTRANIMHI